MLNRAWGRWANKIQAEGWGWEGRAGRSRARKSSFRGWVSSHWKSKHFKMKSSDDWSSNTHTLPNTYTHTHTLLENTLRSTVSPMGGPLTPPLLKTLFMTRWDGAQWPHNQTLPALGHAFVIYTFYTFFWHFLNLYKPWEKKFCKLKNGLWIYKLRMLGTWPVSCEIW